MTFKERFVAKKSTKAHVKMRLLKKSTNEKTKTRMTSLVLQYHSQHNQNLSC